MSKSDSTTSLSELPIVDTACRFCRNPEDPESGKALMDARIFLSCDCRITTHLDCWKEFIQEHTGRLVCPSCEKPIPSWKQPKQPKDDEEKQEKRTPYVREITIALFTITAIFLIAFSIIYLKK